MPGVFPVSPYRGWRRVARGGQSWRGGSRPGGRSGPGREGEVLRSYEGVQGGDEEYRRCVFV